MKKFRWRENTEDGLRFYSIQYFGENLTLSSKLKEEETWIKHNPISLEEWKKIRSILFRLYQRNRCPWKVIESVDKILEEDITLPSE